MHQAFMVHDHYTKYESNNSCARYHKHTHKLWTFLNKYPILPQEQKYILCASCLYGGGLLYNMNKIHPGSFISWDIITSIHLWKNCHQFYILAYRHSIFYICQTSIVVDHCTPNMNQINPFFFMISQQTHNIYEKIDIII